MNSWATAIAAVAAAYLIGSIPTAYLLVRAVKGTDVRTLGSGNVGATNAGRALGRWGFWTVFVIDLLKGLLPTLLLPMAAVHLSSADPLHGLPVVVAVAAILGHNFPIWLGFRGGKGVATTLGAVTALEPIASGAAAAAFLLSVGASRMVSLSSMIGAAAFLAVYFGRTADPWSEERRVMSTGVVGLGLLLVFRHRTNLARIARGTEPRIGARVDDAPERSPRSGRVALTLLGVMLCLALSGAWLATVSGEPAAIEAGGIVLQPLGRVQTGHQRAERVVFFEDGGAVAVACPRYDRLMLYEVSMDRTLTSPREVKLPGKPMALGLHQGELVVLMRPSGDARHLEPGFWQRYDRRGEPIGRRYEVGYDPDDLVFLASSPTALVLLSGYSEGEMNRPPPELLSVDVSAIDDPQVLGREVLGDAGTNPTRLRLSQRETHASVATFQGELIGIDLADPSRPRATDRVSVASDDLPEIATTGGEGIVVAGPRAIDPISLDTVSPGLLAWVDESEGSLLISRSGGIGPMPRYRPKGPLDRGEVRATGLAFHAGRGLLALADRSGGVRLLSIERATD